MFLPKKPRLWFSLKISSTELCTGNEASIRSFVRTRLGITVRKRETEDYGEYFQKARSPPVRPPRRYVPTPSLPWVSIPLGLHHSPSPGRGGGPWSAFQSAPPPPPPRGCCSSLRYRPLSSWQRISPNPKPAPRPLPNRCPPLDV